MRLFSLIFSGLARSKPKPKNEDSRVICEDIDGALVDFWGSLGRAQKQIAVLAKANDHITSFDSIKPAKGTEVSAVFSCAGPKREKEDAIKLVRSEMRIVLDRIETIKASVDRLWAYDEKAVQFYDAYLKGDQRDLRVLHAAVWMDLNTQMERAGFKAITKPDAKYLGVVKKCPDKVRSALDCGL